MLSTSSLPHQSWTPDSLSARLCAHSFHHDAAVARCVFVHARSTSAPVAFRVSSKPLPLHQRLQSLNEGCIISLRGGNQQWRWLWSRLSATLNPLSRIFWISSWHHTWVDRCGGSGAELAVVLPTRVIHANGLRRVVVRCWYLLTWINRWVRALVVVRPIPVAFSRRSRKLILLLPRPVVV